MFDGLYGQIASYFILPLIGTALTAITAWGVRAFGKIGVDVSEVHAQQFQVAVTNAAGVLVNKMSTGTIKGSDIVAEALKLARTLILDNPDAVNGVGITANKEKRDAKVAEKIMAKAAGVSVQAPEATVSVEQLGDKVTAGPPPGFVGSVAHRT